MKLFDSDSPKTALIAGDVDLGITWTGEAFTAQQENPAFTFAYPTEGTILWQDNWAMDYSTILTPIGDTVMLGELPLFLWLLIQGVKDQQRTTKEKYK